MNALTAPSTDQSAAATTPRRRLRWALVLMSAAVLVTAWLAWQWVEHGMPLPVEIVIDGERQLVHAQITSLPWTDKAAIAGGIAVAAIAVALALGVAAIAVLMALVLVLLLAVALPLLLGSAVLLVLLSPLWLLAWLLWRTAVAPRRSGTMTA